MTEYSRPDGRAWDQHRPTTITPGYQKYAEGSALIEMGSTKVLCAASLEERVPAFLRGQGKGWVTAEYSMLPRATNTRTARERDSGRPSGRSQEIQRLIGRSLRAVTDLEALGERTVQIDCDVIQADGGTRTAAITGAYVALVEALARALLTGDLERWPLIRQLAAVSVGYVDGAALLDLQYSEDSVADVDMNVVATAGGELVEIQGTGEQRSFRRDELSTLLDLAFPGIDQLTAAQNRILAPTLAEVDTVRDRGRRRTPPKDEGDLWGAPP